MPLCLLSLLSHIHCGTTNLLYEGDYNMRQVVKLKKLYITFHNQNTKEDTEKMLLNFLSEIMLGNTIEKLKSNKAA